MMADELSEADFGGADTLLKMADDLDELLGKLAGEIKDDDSAGNDSPLTTRERSRDIPPSPGRPYFEANQLEDPSEMEVEERQLLGEFVGLEEKDEKFAQGESVAPTVDAAEVEQASPDMGVYRQIDNDVAVPSAGEDVHAQVITEDVTSDVDSNRDASQDVSSSISLLTGNLRPAPLEFGADMFIVSKPEIQSIVDLKVQKYQVQLNALKRYTAELENDLEQKEDELDAAQEALAGEQSLRLAAEAERDSLLQKKATLEAKLIEDGRARQTAESDVTQMDRELDEIAQRLARSEITETEAIKPEEELMRAQARRLVAQQTHEQAAVELEQVSAATEKATRMANAASEGEAMLAQKLEAMNAEVERMKAERDAQLKLREEADFRFNQLVQRIQAKVGRTSGS